MDQPFDPCDRTYCVSDERLRAFRELTPEQCLHLPFELLNDNAFELANTLCLPTFEYNSARLIKRLTLIIEIGRICKVFYPVLPPNENAAAVTAWLRANSRTSQ
jgi:peroxiredoxin